MGAAKGNVGRPFRTDASPLGLVLLLAALWVTSSAAALAQDKADVEQLFNAKFGFLPAKVPGVEAHLPLLNRALNAELHFFNKLCRPTAEQLAEVKYAGAVAVYATATTYAMMVRRRGTTESWPDPNFVIADAIKKTVDAVMPDQAAETYRRELQLRKTALREANVGVMVNLIDDHLYMDARQHQQMYDMLRKDWDPDWSAGEVALLFEAQSAAPDVDTLSPLLSESQKQLWASRLNRRRIRLTWQVRFGISKFFAEMELPMIEFVDEAGNPIVEPGGK